MVYNTRLFRDRSLRKAYGFARSGNTIWAYLWLNQAHSYLTPSDRQLRKFRKLLNAATSAAPTLVATEAANMENRGN